MNKNIVLVMVLVLAVTFLVVVQVKDVNWVDKGAVQNTAKFDLDWVTPGSVSAPKDTNSTKKTNSVDQDIEIEELNGVLLTGVGITTDSFEPYNVKLSDVESEDEESAAEDRIPRYGIQTEEEYPYTS